MSLIRSLILRFIIGIILSTGLVSGFSSRCHLLQRFRTSSITTCQNWLGDLWEEVIEFSTYGPSERKMLKERRERAAALKENRSDKYTGEVSMDSFRRAQQKYKSGSSGEDDRESSSASIGTEDSLSLESSRSAVASKDKAEKEEIDFDGYKLRDLIVEKWGVPLDVDFQRGYGGSSVYCTVLPVAFGSSKCRHESELDYLMHLQAVVEVLDKYDNLDPFIFFIKKTNRVPKRGVESVPYLMDLDTDALKQIL
mmetsp:Transcript_27362/g.74824  ORF Transcript_27362/g.74824 Transcript_27362/m.74824 type:complete len:253 (+) Transcript_27362:73-831(+)